ncbi:ribonuclease H-like domain-containing protein [Flammula alnicola]|nr:ribonuclease H-like domain-containing protein [Flammula alnicola]
MAPAIIFVDTAVLLEECLSDISSSTSNPVSKLAIDLEGVELCRFGRISILQILSDTSDTIWLIDITTLGKEAFDHADPEGRTLKRVLENGDTKKLFYDVRNDADALLHLYGVELENVCDLQVLEVAVRRSRKIRVKVVSGLGKTIETYLTPPPEWQRIKSEGAALCFPDKGGSYEVFERRPLDERVLAYAAQDVALLFKLEDILESRIGFIGKNWKRRVMNVSAARVHEAHNTTYARHGKHRTIAPII